MTTLSDALAAHEIELPAEQLAMVGEYCRLLWDWNQRLNLTRHLDFETFVARDVNDSVQLARLIDPGETLLDVGSGGGVPGILVAIIRPDVSVALCDSIQKKTRALQDIVDQLKLPVEVIHGRVQELLHERSFSTLAARAVGPLPKILRWVAPHWSSIGRLLLIKGPRWVEERGEARHLGLMHELELRKLASYPMPGTDSESVILSVTRPSSR